MPVVVCSRFWDRARSMDSRNKPGKIKEKRKKKNEKKKKREGLGKDIWKEITNLTTLGNHQSRSPLLGHQGLEK